MNSEHHGDNRLTNMSGTEYEYDDSGNQLGVESEGTSYFLSTFMNGEKWNLCMALLENESVWASYSYSLDGRRVGKEIDIERTGEDFQRVYYLYVDMDAKHPLEFWNEFRINGQNVVYELGEMFRNFREIPNIGGIALQFQHNHPTVRYTHPLVCDGGVCGPTAYMFVDAPISIVVDGVKYYYLYDALGSVTELIDENENVVNRYRYTPFGESLYKVEGVFNPYQYTGRRYDEETGQYYYRARMYSPGQGRFLSQDPMGMIDGPNMYAYARNNPVNFRDPTGRTTTPSDLEGIGVNDVLLIEHASCSDLAWKRCWKAYFKISDSDPSWWVIFVVPLYYLASLYSARDEAFQSCFRKEYRECMQPYLRMQLWYRNYFLRQWWWAGGGGGGENVFGCPQARHRHLLR